ncbi:hypothetical protein [Kitasatospora sp. NPDC001683]
MRGERGPCVRQHRLADPGQPHRARTASGRSLRFFGARLEGVRLRATDADWSYGQGPLPVEGRAEHLLLVAYGRRLPAGLLSGAGAERFTR